MAFPRNLNDPEVVRIKKSDDAEACAFASMPLSTARQALIPAVCQNDLSSLISLSRSCVGMYSVSRIALKNIKHSLAD